MVHAVAAQQAAPVPGRPEGPRRLAPRPVPGLTAPAAPAAPAEPPLLRKPKAIPQPAAAAAPEGSGPARILFIHRRGTFRLPGGAMEIKAPKVEATMVGRPAAAATPAPLAEGEVRIIPGPWAGARAVPPVAPVPPARRKVRE